MPQALSIDNYGINNIVNGIVGTNSLITIQYQLLLADIQLIQYLGRK